MHNRDRYHCDPSSTSAVQWQGHCWRWESGKHGEWSSEKIAHQRLSPQMLASEAPGGMARGRYPHEDRFAKDYTKCWSVTLCHHHHLFLSFVIICFDSLSCFSSHMTWLHKPSIFLFYGNFIWSCHYSISSISPFLVVLYSTFSHYSTIYSCRDEFYSLSFTLISAVTLTPSATSQGSSKYFVPRGLSLLPLSSSPWTVIGESCRCW